MLTIRSVEARDDYWLRLTLSDGITVDRNVRGLLLGPVFEGLRTNYALFRCARVRKGTVEWPGAPDLDPSVLIWNGPRPHRPTAPADRLVLTHAARQAP
jgi:hypothetical protein